MNQAPPDTTATHFRYSLLLREIDRLRAADGVVTVGLMLIQLSGLDDVNGRFGYLGGDKVLEVFATRLRGIAREQDRIFEVNARTFALLLHNPLHEGHAVLAAERVTRAALEPVQIGAGQACVKTGIGISLLPDPARNGEELLRQCELALDSARRRDEPHVLYTDALLETREASVRHSWFDVEDALRAGEFEIYYQPQVTLATGRLKGAEALVRWQKPGGECVQPGHFMAAIENSRGIRRLLQFVLNSALRESAAWASQYPGFGISINLAAGNLEDPDLVELVEDAAGVWNLPLGQLTLELTESSLMQNPMASMRTLDRLRQIGLRTSIDDFGTGYSSLSYLRELPADELKVDRSFVGQVMAAERDRDIVASIVQLAHAVELTVVAEGIEDPATLAALVAMRCDIGQGYYFGRPVPAREFEQRWILQDAARGAAS